MHPAGSRHATGRAPARRGSPEPPAPAPGHRRHHRAARLHLVLARGGHRALRPRLDRVLHRRHRRGGDRQGRPLVHRRGDAVLLRGARRVRRVVRDVRARRRLPGRQGGDGRHARQVVGLGAHVRLRPHRADQRRVGGAVHRGARQRAAPRAPCAAHAPARRHLGRHRGRHHALLLAPEHPRHRGVERQGDEDHGRHHGDGGGDDGVVRGDVVDPRCDPAPPSRST